ncbi:MAG: GNAT family N-acetyltransferase [Betaproteobacteria bacterium]|nr:MAG: GNAT family N-acetyltransferase [Betaproteobacteria bacterium]
MRFTSFADLNFSQWEPMWLDYAGDRRSELSRELNEITFSRLQTQTSELQGLAAWHEEPVGFAHFFFHPSTWSRTQECYLQDIYVSPSARGTGIGRNLILEVAKTAREQDCTVLHWRTRSANIKAQAMYEKIARRLDYVEFEIGLG